MSGSLDGIRVRLIQIRDRPDVLADELASFRERTGLRGDQILSTSALLDPLSIDLLEDVDAVLIGGASAYSVTQTYGWTAPLIVLCRACAERSLPLFGSCWGHQFVARAFGGEVVHDPDRGEIGTHEVSLTEAAASDPVFRHLPSRLPVQMGHHDRVSRLPESGVELATSRTAPIQAFRIEGAPVYGTQFHSELDATRVRARMMTYRRYYANLAEEATFREIYDSVRQTPDADALLRTFLEEYCGA